MVTSPMGLGTRNQFFGKIQQQFSSQSGNAGTDKIATTHTDRYKQIETEMDMHTDPDTHKDVYTVIQIYVWIKTHTHTHSRHKHTLGYRHMLMDTHRKEETQGK
jgi:hypothetical protein